MRKGFAQAPAATFASLQPAQSTQRRARRQQKLAESFRATPQLKLGCGGGSPFLTGDADDV